MINEKSSGDRRPVTASPIYRAMSETDLPLPLVESAEQTPSPGSLVAMDRSVAVVRRHVADGTIYGEDGLVASQVLTDLADAGYWGLRVAPEFGGTGSTLGEWAPFVAQIAAANPWVAGLSSTHAGLGPVNLIGTFGTEEQKARLLPPLAAGHRLGAFAVTEPRTASDWGAIRTTATRTGDWLELTGEKLFISNAAPGRTAAVLCKVGDRLTMLVVELPQVEDNRFRTVRYDLHAPRHVGNRGLIFDRMPVPATNALQADGRSVAYHGLNHGRVLVCAFAAGVLRVMTASLIPWVQVRRTFGDPIGIRELVQRRLGRLAARIVACDALLAWSSQLLDGGYRGELECVATKVFASEAVKEATVDLFLKSYASRAFLRGNFFAEAVYDLLAQTVYEGENEILTLGFFSSLAKAWLSSSASPQPVRPVRSRASVDLDALTAEAGAVLRESGGELDAALRKHGDALVQRQALAVELAQRIQQATVMAVVARYGTRQQDPLVREAAVCMAAELSQRLSGDRPTDSYRELVTNLGAAVAADRFAPIAGVPRGTVAMTDHAIWPVPVATAA